MPYQCEHLWRPIQILDTGRGRPCGLGAAKTLVLQAYSSMLGCALRPDDLFAFVVGVYARRASAVVCPQYRATYHSDRLLLPKDASKLDRQHK